MFKKIIISLLSLVLLQSLILIISFQEKKETQLHPKVQAVSESTKKEIEQYTKEKIEILMDSIGHSSKFNRLKISTIDFILKRDKSKKEIQKQWDKIYKIEEINAIANRHLSSLKLSKSNHKDYTINVHQSNYLKSISPKINFTMGKSVISLSFSTYVIILIVTLIIFLFARMVIKLMKKLEDIKQDFRIHPLLASLLFIILFICIEFITYYPLYVDELTNILTHGAMQQINIPLQEISDEWIKLNK